MRHPATGRTHASSLPRPLGNGIPHHHTLLHLAKFTEVLLQALCGDSRKKQGGGWEMWLNKPGICTRQAPVRDVLAVAADRQWGSGRTTLCLCPPPPGPQRPCARGHLTIQHNSPSGPAVRGPRSTNKAALGDDGCFDTAAAAQG